MAASFTAFHSRFRPLTLIVMLAHAASLTSLMSLSKPVTQSDLVVSHFDRFTRETSAPRGGRDAAARTRVIVS
jgi:hypothetical protein